MSEKNWTDSDIHVGEKLDGLTGMAILPDGRLAVAQRGSSHVILAFDLQKKEKSVLCNTYADAHPWNIALNPDDKKLYIAYKAKGEVGRVGPAKGDNQNVEIIASGLPNAMDVKFDANLVGIFTSQMDITGKSEEYVREKLGIQIQMLQSVQLPEPEQLEIRMETAQRLS